ncbi:olfactomedin-4-like [Leucoraja erinacea]|uniref:olfactomedin-4-like n=1 Tax=Leucoraja erinaceus TaxID=7782 RepID=UPI002456E71A|nr:olfactomedin-4-like [Leucoraja erinacea]XP_055519793.1 olfactomedin-4-like [Leucoraja erinacea]
MAKWFLLLLVAILETSAQISTSKAFNGTVNSDLVCVCSVTLPDTTFPADKMEYLIETTSELNISVQAEYTKVKEYGQTLSVYASRLVNLTQRVENIETGGSYTQLDFELLKLEIRELVALTSQLKDLLNGSNTIIDQLYEEIENMSLIVHQLESYDRNNVLQIRKDMAALRERLEECERDQAVTPPPIDYGSCKHGGLLTVTEPFIVQQNWMGSSYPYGAWGKDPVQEQYFVVASTVESSFQTFRFYPSYDDLLLYQNWTERNLGYSSYYNRAQGAGMVLYNNSVYYNCYNGRNICRYNIDTGAIDKRILANAAYNNRFSYYNVKYQDMDFAVDETGLWVIYSTEQHAGRILLSKINTEDFTVGRTWVTEQFKPSVTNAFMICGVLYALRPVGTQTEEIFYTFDTRTGEEGEATVRMEKVMETLRSVSYNPSDHKLYVYNDGYLVSYDVTFKPDQ